MKKCIIIVVIEFVLFILGTYYSMKGDKYRSTSNFCYSLMYVMMLNGIFITGMDMLTYFIKLMSLQ